MSEEMIPLRKNVKKGLGRGLGSLLGEVESSNSAPATVVPQPSPQATVVIESPKVAPKPEVDLKDRILRVGIERLEPNREQPRKSFDQQRLQELSSSIKEKGMLLPIVVKSLPSGKYQIVAGERRWRAAQLAGLHEVPILLKEATEGETLELALIENIQRQDLNPMEEAEAYGILAAKYKLTQEQIAKKVSKERSTIANLMRLLALTPEVKSFVRSGEITLGQAKVLLSLTNSSLQIIVAKKIIQQKLSVRAVERLVLKINKQEGSEVQIETETANLKELKPLTSELQKITGTKVEIQPMGEGFKVAFYFYSTPELNQFVEKLRNTDR